MLINNHEEQRLLTFNKYDSSLTFSEVWKYDQCIRDLNEKQLSPSKSIIYRFGQLEVRDRSQ